MCNAKELVLNPATPAKLIDLAELTPSASLVSYQLTPQHIQSKSFNLGNEDILTEKMLHEL